MPLSSNSAAPTLSVILVTPNRYSSIRRTMRHLHRQTAREQLEVILVVPSREHLQPQSHDEELWSDFHSLHLLEVGAIKTLSAAKARAVQHASAANVVFAEDHAYPDPEWAAALIEAFEQGYAAVGPLVSLANPRTGVGRANFAVTYLRFSDRRNLGVTNQVAWHNAAYKRELLLSYDDLPRQLAVEGILQDKIAAAGHGLYTAERAHVRHISISRLVPHVTHAYLGGWLYASARVQGNNWGWLKRVVYILGAPAIPLVRLKRLLGELNALPEQRPHVPRMLPYLMAALLAHALGEWTGYLVGERHIEVIYTDFEANRWRDITALDRKFIERQFTA